LGLRQGALPFVGADLWRAWELSWLEPSGKPAIAVAEIEVPAASPNLIESKSLKLYLGSLNNHRVAGIEALGSLIAGDLEVIAGAPVGVRIILADALDRLTPGRLEGDSLDGFELVESAPAAVDSGTLSCAGGGSVAQAWVSDLFRSLCPITGQPDWASVRVAYRGPAIAGEPLLRYLLSYREHGGFHEACVEQIFSDVLERCAPRELTVQACFTRRGGIDINPWRSTGDSAPAVPRPWRS
jgi:7-cyano-7-deazaguanine reductase